MKNNKGKTPIYYAIKEGNRKIFNSLREKSAEINLNDYKGMIHEAACDEKNVNCIKLLLEIGVGVDEGDEKGKTALHYAVEKDTLANVITLIEAGANVNAEDNNGNIPLHFAVEEPMIIGYLIDFTTNIDYQNKKGKTPLHLAISNRNDFVIRLLIARKAFIHLADIDGNTPLHLAIKSNEANIPTILIDLLHPLDLNRQNNQGETPLHLAVLYNSLPLVKQLLDKGADLNLETKQKKTALDLARDKKYIDILKHLITMTGSNKRRVHSELDLEPGAKRQKTQIE